MKSLQIKGIILLVCIMLLAAGVKRIMPEEQKSPYLRKIEEQEAAKNLRWYGAVNRYAVVTVPSAILLTFLIGVSCWGLAHIKKASVHVYKIAENEVVVHERDLSIAAPIAMGLMNAEQLKQMNGGVERAFELYERMAQVQSKQFKALGAGSIPQNINSSKPFELASAHTPTFADMLNDGSIQAGKPMILGYENHAPRYGSFLDIYSAAVAGESGSGKTSTMLFLIGSGLVSQCIHFHILDPHYPHPKSLGYKARALWKKGVVHMSTDKQEMFDTLQRIEDTIDNRLAQRDIDDTPVVLVIDELAFLAKQAIGPTLARTMERISTEGRKCAVYMLASSQTWLASRTGGKEKSSVVRDTLTSAYVHRIKPKQANLLLQDKDEAEKVKRYVKQAGEVLLCPVNDDSVICQMPYTTEQDMVRVSGMVEPIFVNEPVNVPVNARVVNEPVNVPVNATKLNDSELVNAVNAKLKKGDLDNLAQSVGVSKAMLSMVLHGKRNVSEKIRTGLIAHLEHDAKIIPFPKGETYHE